MNTNNTTPALADLDLDLDKLAAIANRIEARGLFNAACDIRDWIQEAHSAAARRAAQPVAPVQDKPVATVIKKGAERQWMSENLGSLPDGMYSLYLAPSPQVAEGAELPPLPKTGEQVPNYQQFNGSDMRQYARDAIAASRRATPAPASAGQAAPQDVDAHTTSYNQGYRAGIEMGKALAADELAAQPAEGAGQAGQVAMPRHQVWDYAHECWMDSDEEGYYAAMDDDRRIIWPDSAPTERAAAPADKMSSKNTAHPVDKFYENRWRNV